MVPADLHVVKPSACIAKGVHCCRGAVVGFKDLLEHMFLRWRARSLLFCSDVDALFNRALHSACICCPLPISLAIALTPPPPPFPPYACLLRRFAHWLRLRNYSVLVSSGLVSVWVLFGIFSICICSTMLRRGIGKDSAVALPGSFNVGR